MRALVVYESMFGNTRNVALAIAEGIGAAMVVDAVEVSGAPTLVPADVALLVVGGPTHAHGLSSATSRANAARRADGIVVSAGSGLREWLAAFQPAAGVVAAAFDTRIKGPMLFTGSAATSVTKQLQKHIKQVDPPRSFVLDGATGPLTDRVSKEELAAARAWGRTLGAQVTSR